MTELLAHEKEKAILNAARKRFAHYGFSKVTMDEIAGDIEMGKASLYYYFPAKEDLFKAVIIEEQNEFIKEIERMLKSPISAGEKIHEYVSLRLKYFQSFINLGTAGVHSFHEIKSTFKQLFIDFEEKELTLLMQIAHEGISNNEFCSDCSDKETKVFLHILQGLRLRMLSHLKGQALEAGDYNNLLEEMNIAANIFLKGLKNK
jgi:TetR/AcrR family transcriptional repressor of mexJK operon